MLGRLTTHPRRIGPYIDTWPGAFLPNGRYLDWGLAFPDEGAGVAGRRIVLQPIVLSATFQTLDTLPPLEFASEMAMIAGRSRPVPFFNGSLIVAVGPAADIWFAHTREYRVYRRTPAGDTTRVFTLPAEPAAIGEAEREYVRSRLRSRPALLEDYLEALPESRPILHRILVDGAGHLFIFADLAGVPPGSFVDVFRDSGKYLGRLTLPRRVALNPPGDLVAYAAPGHLLVVTMDDADVPYVSRFRIMQPVRAVR